MNKIEIKDCILNEEILDKLKGKLMNPMQKIPLSVLLIIGMISFIIGVVSKDSSYLIFGIIYIILFSFLYLYIQKRDVALNVKRLKEMYGSDVIRYNLVFEEEQFKYTVEKNNNFVYIKYKDIARIVSSDLYYIIFTKAKMYIIIEKSKINEDDEKKIFDLINKNNKQYKK